MTSTSQTPEEQAELTRYYFTNNLLDATEIIDGIAERTPACTAPSEWMAK